MQLPYPAAATFITEAMKTALSDAFSGIASDVSTMATVALPSAIGIAGLLIAIRLSVKFFKNVAN